VIDPDIVFAYSSEDVNKIAETATTQVVAVELRIIVRD
jgi:hypothetical protein